jgi:hypothetical protein
MTREDFLETVAAAELLHRRPQTLRQWASKGGPISPVRVNGFGGRLLWRRSDIEAILGGNFSGREKMPDPNDFNQLKHTGTMSGAKERRYEKNGNPN